jgi:hypothetical protein
MLHAEVTVVVPIDIRRVPLAASAGWLISSGRLDMFTFAAQF